MASVSAKKQSQNKSGKKPGKPIEYITPPNVLRAKLKSATPSVYDPLAAADNALDNIKRECEAWVADAIDALQQCRVAVCSAPDDTAVRRSIERAAMDLKGIAKTGNNPAADRFATSLITLLTERGGVAFEHHAAQTLTLLEAHVDAIRATRDVRHADSHCDKTADALATELESRAHSLLGLDDAK